MEDKKNKGKSKEETKDEDDDSCFDIEKEDIKKRLKEMGYID
jgi:hypothetical protein